MSSTLYLSSVKLIDFKNHEKIELEFSPTFNGISGLNGKGKTNLLDAIYYLTSGRSYFNIADKQSIKEGATHAFLKGTFIKNNETIEVTVGISQDKKKVIKSDGAICKKLSDFIGQFSAVIITPADISIVTGGSEDRRNFIDRIICQHNKKYLNALNVYHKLLESRNRALKNMAESGIFNEALIEVYNVQIEEPSRLIFEIRKEFIQWMALAVAEIYQRISGEIDQIHMTYESQLLQDELSSLFVQNATKDRILGRTSAGVHKDDLTFLLNHKFDLRKYGSQGQIKSWITSLKLAAMLWLSDKNKQIPILLLDDIFEKIDDNRLKNLLHWLMENHHGQWFVTDAHKNRLEESVSALRVEKKFFNIDDSFNE